jgi:hypothetical protein
MGLEVGRDLRKWSLVLGLNASVRVEGEVGVVEDKETKHPDEEVGLKHISS